MFFCNGYRRKKKKIDSPPEWRTLFRKAEFGLPSLTGAGAPPVGDMGCAHAPKAGLSFSGKRD